MNMENYTVLGTCEGPSVEAVDVVANISPSIFTSVYFLSVHSVPDFIVGKEVVFPFHTLVSGEKYKFLSTY